MPMFKQKRMQCLILLIVMFLPLSLLAKTAPNNQESYAYRFIVNLYELGERDALEGEIRAFETQYPHSDYRYKLRYITANMMQEKEKHADALEAYDELLRQNLELSLRHQVYLSKAVSLLATKQYSQGMLQLDFLESESKNPALISRANLYRARTYRHLGQHHGALKYYQLLLDEGEREDVKYEYLEILLNLDKQSEAKLFLDEMDDADKNYVKSHVTYCKYLLDNNKLEDLSEHLKNIKEIEDEPNIELIRLRLAFSSQDFNSAGDILNNTENYGDYLDYYQGLYLLHNNELEEAEEIFAKLVGGGDSQLAVLAYLERIKILFESEPQEAIRQLKSFMAQKPQVAYAQQLYTMSHFAYVLEDYSEALRYLALARGESENRALLSEIDFMIAQSWMRLERYNQAAESYNRYLNLYPDGDKRDASLFYQGYIYFQEKDYKLAIGAFNEIIKNLPESEYLNSAAVYLAEIDFFQANYRLSLSAFGTILRKIPQDYDTQHIRLRMAQCYYYLERYKEALSSVERLNDSYDKYILWGHIGFNQKEYNTAVKAFDLAIEYADNDVQLKETKSYLALTNYKLKRYDEASRLYLELYDGDESPDTFLYLGAKSAYAAGDFNLAYNLFERFVDEFPESDLFLSVLTDMANVLFNMENYEEAYETYQSVLSRFRNKNEFNPREQGLLAEVFTGIELSLMQIENDEIISELADSIDSFKSHYLRFELSYLITRLYAKNEDWLDVLDRADRIRESFPERENLDLNLLTAQGLIKLHEYEQADTLLSSLYEETKDVQALLYWAEIDLLFGNYEAALEKYIGGLRQGYDEELWLFALKASHTADYQDFLLIWELGKDEGGNNADARLLYLSYLIEDERLSEARTLADEIIAENLDPFYHAKAFYSIGLIRFEQSFYIEAIWEFRKLRVLFPDYEEILSDAAYYSILSYLKLGAREEAKLLFLDSSDILTEDQRETFSEVFAEEE